LTVHFAIASFAVTGVVLAVLGRASNERPTSGRVAILGGRLALISTLCQIPAGVWLMTQIPGSDQRRLLGEDVITASLFVTALLATFWLLHLFAAIAFGDTSAKTVWRAAAMLLAVVLLMTGTLQRGQRHEPHAAAAQQRVSERNTTWLSSASPSRTPTREPSPRSL
jgi:hypothetical protein